MKLNDEIVGDEDLYRVIKRSKPGWLDYGKPTSAMFRDENGVSVDRDGGRTMSEIRMELMNQFGKRLKGAVVVKAQRCFDVGALVKADPSRMNPFHANIWLDLENKKREMLQAYQLASASKVVFIDESVDWV